MTRLLFIICVILCVVFGEATILTTGLLARTQEIRHFQEYIQIDTVNGKRLNPAVNFWRKLALGALAKFSVYTFAEDYPVVVIKWSGRNSSLSSIMLNTHMDVVPADMMDGWTYPPFSAHIDENGDIYGRGTQEVKSVTMQHYHAILRLKKKNVSLLRDVYMVITPDKETGSNNGMVPFLRSSVFKKMNVGLSISGGEPTTSNEIPVLHRWKTRWSFRVECYGPSAASSELVYPAITADGSCGLVFMMYSEYREKQYKLSQKPNCSDLTNITVINFVGPEVNTLLGVLPSRIYLFYDSYLSVSTNFSDFEAMVKQWLVDAGGVTKLKTLLRQDAGPEVKIGKCNPYWDAIQQASKNLNITFDARTAPGPEEASYITAAGYPAFGISPLPNTENLIHAINERLNVGTYLKGISIFEEIFKQVTNIPEDQLSANPSDYLVL